MPRLSQRYYYWNWSEKEKLDSSLRCLTSPSTWSRHRKSKSTSKTICGQVMASVAKTMTAFNVRANGMPSSKDHNLTIKTALRPSARSLAGIRLPPLSIIDNLKTRPPGGSHAVELPLRGTFRAVHQKPNPAGPLHRLQRGDP